MASGSLACSSPEIEHHLSITAREGDLNAVGSQLKAGNDVALSASRDLNLISAENASLLEGKNESKGGTVGVGIGVGSGGWGISVSASVNKGKGSESGNGTTHSETTVDAGNSLILNSGRDTTLTGAQVSGDTVIADIGRNLTLTSEQDSDRYDSKQQNASAGGSFTFGSMSGSASVNLSKDKMHSNYDSVVEQTGIFAGKGGYDITVGEHTRLDGAVIGSTATADKNRLDTGTLGWGDIDNRADFKTEHQSVGFSTGGSIGSQFAGNMANGLLTGGNNEGHDSSTTHAAVSDGTLIVCDQGQQTQNVANLSRDVEHANQTLSPIFDKEKEQQRLQQTRLIGEIGNQVADIARTEGQISAINAGKAELAKEKINESEKGASKEAREKYNAQLAATEGYKAAQQQWGTGSSVQQAIQAATAAVQGLAGGDLKAALAGGAAPYVAEVIGHYSNLDDAGKVAAHAVVNAALAAAQNQSALAGAAGAATGELIGIIATQMYGKTVSELDETQRQTVSTLATLAAGLAGGLAGDSSASAVSGAQAGKTTVENNYLSSTQALAFDKELADCRKSGGDCQAVIDKWKQVSDKQSAETDQKLKDNPLEAVVVDKEVAQGGIDMADRPDWLNGIGADVMSSDEAKAYVQQWNGRDLTKIDQNSPEWMKYAAFVSDPENQAALVSLGMLGKDLVLIAKNSFTTKSLFNEMTTQGIKFTPENVVSAAKDSSGKIIFLEKGSSKAGLQHIVESHGSQFAQIGVSEARIPDIVMKAVTDGKIVGYQGNGTGRPIYETMINGKKYNIAVTVGNNGYIVGANLRGSVK
ncbi:hypothetical protein M2416_003580 [Raoultella sp. BIGb0132]|nr:hypothetical protein [Raoultella sp. BIGb0132]MCS4289534.1 hypothetical protein [Raoultella terrigena]